jgi:hypothetical protein
LSKLFLSVEVLLACNPATEEVEAGGSKV